MAQNRFSGSKMLFALVAASPLVLAGCASDGEKVEDPYFAKSAQKFYGPQHDLSLFRRGNRGGGGPPPAPGDPEYEEYLQWKQWQEFKKYQEWKEQQSPGESGPAPAGQDEPSTS